MRLAISNIAWDIEEDEAVANLLRVHRLDAIDIAPGKYFPSPVQASNRSILDVKQWWGSRGIEITGMQALLFGTTGLNVFGPAESQKELLAHLTAVCRIGRVLGATRVVFGSPKNRDRTGLSDHESLERACDFFRRLGAVALNEGVSICLEPNPTRYGANFMTTSVETAQVVEAVGHSAIRMQIDTGAMTINRENPVEIVARYAHLVGHIHASEPDLVPLGDGATDHAAMCAAFASDLHENIVSIEMVAARTEPHLSAIERAIRAADGAYRSDKQSGTR